METEARAAEENSTPVMERKASRRDAVKVGAAVAIGVASAAYVKPSLRGLGVPVALAVSGPPPPPPTTNACSIALGTNGATGTISSQVNNGNGTTTFSGTATGTFTIKNASSDCGSCDIPTVDVYAQIQSSGLGGCGQDLVTGLVNHVSGNTGGSNPVIANQTMIQAGCTSPQGPYTWSVPYSNVTTTNNSQGQAVPPTFRITIEMTTYPTNAQQTGFEFKVCTTDTV